MTRRGTRANLVVRGARVIDPAQGLDSVIDVVVEKGRITAVGKKAGKAAGLEVLDAAGCLLLPGFVDLQTHLRAPGREDEEDIASGTAAAAAGGYVAVTAMANTDPVVDTAAVLEAQLEAAEKEAAVRVTFTGSITRGLAGERLSEIWDMADAGAVAFSDDGRPVESGALLRAAFQAAQLVQRPLFLHCEDASLAAAGQMHEGTVSAALGLEGIPACAETAAVARDLEIAAYEGARVHVLHVSCAGSLAAVAAARARGAEVTCEVTPHHLVLDHQAVRSLDACTKMNPPLRSEEDRRALVAALADGGIDCIGTDHAPHAPQEKEVPFEEAPFGVIGLETAFPVLYTELVAGGDLPLEVLVRAMSTNPARVLGLTPPAVAEGAEADLCLVDISGEYAIEPERFRSRSRNTAFAGRKVKGRILLTLAGGREAFRDERFGEGGS